MIKECKNNTRQTWIQKPPDNGKQCRFHSNIFYSAKNRSISFFFKQIHLPPSLWPLELNGPLSGSFCCCAFKKGLLHKWNEKLRFAVHSPNSLVAKQHIHILTSSQNNSCWNVLHKQVISDCRKDMQVLYSQKPFSHILLVCIVCFFGVWEW